MTDTTHVGQGSPQNRSFKQIGISHIESATTCTISVMLVGYEY
jgi:hypothetical protein